MIPQRRRKKKKTKKGKRDSETILDETSEILDELSNNINEESRDNSLPKPKKNKSPVSLQRPIKEIEMSSSEHDSEIESLEDSQRYLEEQLNHYKTLYNRAVQEKKIC